MVEKLEGNLENQIQKVLQISSLKQFSYLNGTLKSFEGEFEAQQKCHCQETTVPSYSLSTKVTSFNRSVTSVPSHFFCFTCDIIVYTLPQPLWINEIIIFILSSFSPCIAPISYCTIPFIVQSHGILYLTSSYLSLSQLLFFFAVK